jgi:fibronectin-binding autotransporter adhesin
MRFYAPITTIAAILHASALASTIQAAVVVSGNVTPSPPWTSSSVVKVGDATVGMATVDQGTKVQSLETFLGYVMGSSGDVTITGVGSKWTVSNRFVVGQEGNGTLRVEAGGELSNYYGFLGDSPGTTGEATITGAGSKWTNTSLLAVGVEGSGSLTVSDGAQVTTGILYAALDDLHGDGVIATKGAILDAEVIFNEVGGSQAVLEFGSGGRLTIPAINNTLGVGYRGVGSLAVLNGAEVSSVLGRIGHRQGSAGVATIAGVGSQWTTSQGLAVGVAGSGTLLITDGGSVSSSSSGLGISNGGVGKATVSGAGSKWINSAGLYVGQVSAGDLRVEAGGLVSSSTGSLGSDSAATGVATITGAGSKWTNSAALSVGYEGSGTLRVKEGGLVSNSHGYVGRESDSTGEATIAGQGSQWNNTAPLYVGYDGSGKLLIEAGGLVSNTEASLGYGYGSAGEATIKGLGSQWNSSLSMFIGRRGPGTLRIESGGSVSALAAVIADDESSTSAATVTGAGSQWTLSQGLAVGLDSRGTLLVTAGGKVTSNSGALGIRYRMTGEATVSGVGSEWVNATDLYVGDDGDGILRVEDGGAVSTARAFIGNDPYTRATGTVTITDTDSRLIVTQALSIGSDRGNGILRVEAGGMVDSANGFVGGGRGAIGAATITGEGSQWTNGFTLRVGAGKLRVENGGRVTAGLGEIEGNSYSSGTATITGPGSRWDNMTDLNVGLYGDGHLNIVNGGLVSVGGTLSISTFSAANYSFINMAAGGMLALRGDGAASLSNFLDLIKGTDAVRYWDATLARWQPIAATVPSVDYTLQYLSAGELAGYTLLTVGVYSSTPTSDFNNDGQVDGADFLTWQRGQMPDPLRPTDLDKWKADFGHALVVSPSAVPEPASVVLLVFATVLISRWGCCLQC